MSAGAAAAASGISKGAALQSAATVAAPAIGSAFGLIGAKKRMRLQNQLNMQLAKYQNSLNLAQWNRENEYNKPINQMARLREAGINPRMAYGDSANSQSANSPNLIAGSMQAPTNLGESMETAFGQFGSAIGQMNQIRMMEAEIRNKDQQTAMFKSLTDVNTINARLKALEEIMKAYDANHQDFVKTQSAQLKQWALNNMIGSYYDKFGGDAIGYNKSVFGDMPFSFYPSDFGESRAMLDRRVMASQIALNNAKKFEANSSARNKLFGINWMQRRMKSMDLMDYTQRQLGRLTYHRGNTEMEKRNSMIIQQSLFNMQKAMLEEQIENMQEHRMDFIPFLGNMSDYSRTLLNPYIR